MGLERKNRLNWNDIQNIYNNLNQAREKFQLTTIEVPNETKRRPIPDNVSDLKNEVDDMLSNDYISRANITTSSIIIPTTKTLIYPTPFNAISEAIDQMLNVCPHNGNYNGADFCGSFNTCGFVENGCDTFHSDENFRNFSSNTSNYSRYHVNSF